MKTPRIITIGLAPCWDVTCWAKRWQWNRHDTISRQTARPAGKALNVSRALAEMQTSNTACGLWGRDDLPTVVNCLRSLKPTLQCRMTAVPGRTRHNVTLIDARGRGEIHLRAPNPLLNSMALRRLIKNLDRLVQAGSICVFAGAMPSDKFLEESLAMIRLCRHKRACLVVDSSGPALRHIVDATDLWMIKPNVEELRELVGWDVPDRPGPLIRAARSLLPRIDNILISRGRHGAMLVNARGCWTASVTARKPALSTVGCGDYLLAGFLGAWVKTRRYPDALSAAVKTAALKAWGLTEQPDWPHFASTIRVRQTQRS